MQKIVSGSSLKLIAAASMLIDHSARTFLTDSEIAYETWFSFGSVDFDLMYLLRGVLGRIAFPIFAFLLTEGYIHTHNRRRYGFNLLLFALLSEPIWDVVHGGGWFSLQSQNVLFTLLLGFLGMHYYDCIQNKYKAALVIVALWVISYVGRLDYSGTGVPFIVLLYALRDNRLLQFVSCMAAFTRYHLFAALSFIPIALYNGERGFLCGPISKYFFYFFYPGHLFLLWFLSRQLN